MIWFEAWELEPIDCDLVSQAQLGIPTVKLPLPIWERMCAKYKSLDDLVLDLFGSESM